MRLFEQASEQGMTLIETMMAMVLTSLLAYGGYQGTVKYQKHLNFKAVDQSSKHELSELTATIKKDWDYRLRKSTPGVTANGYELKNAAGGACTQNCPQLILWLRRTIAGASIVDRVAVTNSCVNAQINSTLKPLEGFALSQEMNTACGSCPSGQIPIVAFTGENAATQVKTLAAENRIFPGNAATPMKMQLSGILGMQACFDQTGSGPLSIDTRAFFLDQGSKKLRQVQKTQVFPFENFANIQLEQ